MTGGNKFCQFQNTLKSMKRNEKNADINQKKLSEEAFWLREKQQRANKREKKQGGLPMLE